MTISPSNDPLSAEAVFDTVGPAYETAFADLGAQSASLEWLLSQISLFSSSDSEGTGKKKIKIVDLGCGTGRPVISTLASSTKNSDFEILGIDISSAMISAAKERVSFPNVRFEKRDISEFLASTENGEYTAVTVYFSLIAGMTQSGIKHVLGEIARVLQPGGLFVFATVPLDAENEEIMWMGNKVRVSSLSTEDVLTTLKEVGLEVVFQELSAFTPKAEEAGICKAEDAWEEPHLFVYAKKPAV